jgi:hypothetical protein
METRRPTRVIVACMLSVLGGFAVAAPASAAAGLTKCGTVSGATWSDPGTTKTGKTYTVSTYKYSCSAAKKLVPGLTAQTINPKQGKLDYAPRPPKGMSCPANPDNNNHAFSGHCSKGTALFEWSPPGV